MSAHEWALRTVERALAHTYPGDAAAAMGEYRRGVVGALVELGVLSQSEQREWSARMERAAQPPRPPSRDTCGRALALLEHELDAGRCSGDLVRRRERFLAMLQALLETGTIDWEEKPGWLKRLDEAAPDLSSPYAPPPYPAGELSAVAVGPPERIDGLRITSAELYDDCSIVRWHLVVQEDQPWRERVFIADHGRDLARAHGPQRLHDNLGTTYTRMPIDTTDLDWLRLRQDPETLSGASVFTPATPPHARRLSVSCPTSDFQIDLGHAS